MERIVAVDWSGDQGTGQRRKIWAGVWTAATRTFRLESGRTRDELCAWLIELASETPRMVVGIDFCFSYPAWLLAELGCATVFDFWRVVAEGLGEQWLSRECSDERFWGRRGPHRSGKKPQEFCGAGAARMMRAADLNCKVSDVILANAACGALSDAARDAACEPIVGIAPKSPFQIGGAGAVGTGSLRGIPVLRRLHGAGFRVWPFEAPRLDEPAASPLVVEIYPRLLTGAVKKSNAEGRARYLEAIALRQGEYGGLEPQVLADALAGEDAFDALVSVVAMSRARGSFPTLRKAEDAQTRLEGAVWGAAAML